MDETDPETNPYANIPEVPGAAAAERARVQWPPEFGRRLRDAPVNGTLPPRQVMAARLLLAGGRLTDVAAHLGVNRHTVASWLRDPRFQLEVRRMAIEMPLPASFEGTDCEQEP